MVDGTRYRHCLRQPSSHAAPRGLVVQSSATIKCELLGLEAPSSSGHKFLLPLPSKSFAMISKVDIAETMRQWHPAGGERATDSPQLGHCQWNVQACCLGA